MEKKSIDEILAENEFREAECCETCGHVTYRNNSNSVDDYAIMDPWCELTNNETFREWTCNKFEK